jgi:hypothetical protein
LKNNYLDRIFLFTLVLIVLFPFAAQAAHAMGNHEHKICTAKDVKHIHQQDIDCSIFHQQIDTNSFDLSSDFETYYPQLFDRNFDVYQRAIYSRNNLTKSSRAPPYFII